MICFWTLKLSTPSAVFEASFFVVGERKWGDGEFQPLEVGC